MEKTKNSDVITCVIRTKICCICYVGKLKTFIYNTRNAKNWFIVYHLPTNSKKLRRVIEIMLL